MVKFEAEKVDAFIRSIGIFLFPMKTHVKDIPKHDKKNDLESISKFFKKDVIDNIRSLQHSDVFLSGPENLRTWRVKHIKESHEREHFYANLNETILCIKKSTNRLSQLIETSLQSEDWSLLQKSRSEAIKSGIDYRLAKDYIQYFEEKPTKYDDGPFYNLTKHCLKFVGLPSKDPRRVIEIELEEIGSENQK